MFYLNDYGGFVHHSYLLIRFSLCKASQSSPAKTKKIIKTHAFSVFVRVPQTNFDHPHYFLQPAVILLQFNELPNFKWLFWWFSNLCIYRWILEDQTDCLSLKCFIIIKTTHEHFKKHNKNKWDLWWQISMILLTDYFSCDLSTKLKTKHFSVCTNRFLLKRHESQSFYLENVCCTDIFELFWSPLK